MKKIKPYLNRESFIALTVLVTLFFYWINHSGSSGPLWSTVLTIVTLLGMLPLVFEIIQSIIKKDFGVDLIALIAIVSTLYVGENVASAIILLMLSGGESLERYAENRAKRSLERLLNVSPTNAHIFEHEIVKDIPVSEITVSQKILVKPNEIVPVDGVVLSGVSVIDESTITGEPVPKEVSEGSKIWSGSLNTGNVIIIEARTTYEQSALQSIIRLVEEAENNKAPMVRLADRYSVNFTIITLIIAGIAMYFNPRLGAAVLVVATPCPLILAAPIAFIAGMSRSAKRGIIVKHGGVFEAMTQAKVYLFDKTGTITLGIPLLNKIISHSNLNEDELLKIASSIEQFSTHILAKSVVTKAKEKGILAYKVENQKELMGKGIQAEINGSVYSIGKAELLKNEGVSISTVLQKEIAEESEVGAILVHIAKEKEIIGSLVFVDTIRSNSQTSLDTIKSKDIETVLLTGDTEKRAQTIGVTLGFKTIYANCLPQDKVKIVKGYESKHMKTVMVGDGVNDAPALGAATVGIALGHNGQTASTDTADAIILQDDISKIGELLTISTRTMYIAKQSIVTGMGLSIVAMIFAAFGFLPPIYGALLQEGVDVLVILNALRALKD